MKKKIFITTLIMIMLFSVCASATELEPSGIATEYDENKFRNPSVSPEGYDYVYDFAYRNGQLTGQSMRCYCRTISSHELYFYKDGTLIKFVTLENLQNNTTSNVPCVSTITWYQGSNTSVANSNPYNSTLNATNNQWGYNSGSSLISWSQGVSSPYVIYSGVDIYNSFNDLVAKYVNGDSSIEPIFVNANYSPIVPESSFNHLYLRGVNAQFIVPNYTDSLVDNGLIAINYTLDNWQQEHINEYTLHYTISNSRSANVLVEHSTKLLDSGLSIDVLQDEFIQFIPINQKFFNYYLARPTWNDNGQRIDQAIFTLDLWLVDNNGNSSGHYKKQWSNNSDYDGSILANDLMVNSNPYYETVDDVEIIPPSYNDSGNQIIINNTLPSSSGTITIVNNEPLFIYDFDGVGKYTGSEVRKQLKDMFGLLSVNGNKGYIQSLLELINATGVFGQLLGFGVATTVSISIIRIILRR